MSRAGADPAHIHLGLLMQRWPGRQRPFGLLTPFAETVSLLAGAEGVAVTAFDPADVDLQNDRVSAARFLGEGKGWTAITCPLPDVLWNRYFRRDEGRVLEALGRRGVAMINEGSLNKWDAYRCLLRHGPLREHLPETFPLTSASTALAMLDRYPVVFFKPAVGSVGRGIVRVTRGECGQFRLQYVSTQSGSVRETEATARQVDRWLSEEDRAERYIVQQGLDLNVFHGRPADVRVLVQKNQKGRWRVTGMGARVAAHGRFTANLHTGGQGVPVSLLAEAVHPEDAAAREGLLKTVERLALTTAAAVESSAGPMGEVGLDFGIDTGGNIWFIEQNGQPGRSIFEQIGRPDLSELAHLRPVQYARFLATTKSARAARHPST